MDTERIKDLIAKREEIDRELKEIVTGAAPNLTRKALSCSVCGGSHTARTCPNKEPPKLLPAPVVE